VARVTLEGVRKVFDDGGSEGAVAVHGIDLDVRDAELVVFVGPSGCGKTTVLRMIAGLETVTGGRISIDGRVVNDLPPKARDVAMVFQNYALYPHLTVFDNMAFALRLRNQPRADVEAQVGRVAATLGLGHVLRRKPAQLSGGERQRVAIGRAIVRDPRVFLFDEPLSNLDAALRVQMRREIAALHRSLGATMIYVTHDQVEAMTLGDRIVVMAAGRVQQIAAPLDLYRHPRNRFVGTFIGSPSMTVLPGHVAGGAPPEFRTTSGALAFPLAGALAARLAPYAGRAVLLGIRPEAVALARGPGRGGPTAPLSARVDAIELLGSEALVTVRAADVELTARIDAQDLPAVGATIDLTVALDRLHPFDAETEEAIADPRGDSRA
jgi:multiple sugar transport system ATP-binding protein